MTESWNGLAIHGDIENRITSVQWGTLQKWMNDTSSAGFTKIIITRVE